MEKEKLPFAIIGAGMIATAVAMYLIRWEIKAATAG
jgi:hypothetical protein